MKLQDLIDLSTRLTYQGQQCFSVRDYDWRNKHPSGFHVPVPCPEGYVYVSIWIWANDVDDGKRTKIEVGGLTAITDIEGSTIDSQISHIKDSLVMLQMHEIHETIALDGKRIFDPHNFMVTVIKEAA